ncbi:MAG: SRPBCC family protein [Saprospiraceae bacterium]|nr:SRPBCC family protein [Saprospiraceae bacterium]
MKALKTIGIILAVLLVIIVVLGFIAPKDFNVERSIVIDAPNEMIFPYLQSFEKVAEWTPWQERDPNMQTEIIGTDGTVGAINRWKSKVEGNGEQEITVIVPNERIETKLRFGGMGESNAILTTSDTDGGTKVTWNMNGRSPFPWNVVGMFMNMDKMLGNDFEIGLNKLKNMIESMPKTYRGYAVQEMDAPAQYFIGHREKIKMDEMTSERFGIYLPKVFAAVGAAKIEIIGNPCGLFFMWDEEANQVDLAYAVPVKAKAEVKGFDTFEVPAGKLLIIDYYGPYTGTAEAHFAMDDYMKEHNLEQNPPVWEQYITDPTTEPDTAKWLTKIYYSVKNK